MVVRLLGKQRGYYCRPAFEEERCYELEGILLGSGKRRSVAKEENGREG